MGPVPGERVGQPAEWSRQSRLPERPWAHDDYGEAQSDVRFQFWWRRGFEGESTSRQRGRCYRGERRRDFHWCDRKATFEERERLDQGRHRAVGCRGKDRER